MAAAGVPVAAILFVLFPDVTRFLPCVRRELGRYHSDIATRRTKAESRISHRHGGGDDSGGRPAICHPNGGGGPSRGRHASDGDRDHASGDGRHCPIGAILALALG